ncbi:MAG: hypothetical protein JWM31_3218 [Solirubrobacterales bacterium]|nr:hypothetical protein [Solirubrobacterales bacterium]
MSDITLERDVPGTPEQVAALVTDLARWPEWFALHKGWIGDVPTRAAVGVGFKHKVRVLGVPADVTWEVVELQLPERVVLKGKGSKRTSMRVDFRISARPGGSRVAIEAQVGGLVLKPVGAQLDTWLDVRVDRTLDRLEELLAAS